MALSYNPRVMLIATSGSGRNFPPDQIEGFGGFFCLPLGIDQESVVELGGREKVLNFLH